MSSRYRRVKTSMHSDEKYLKLSRPQPNGQSLWQHLLHGPETTIIPGVVIGGRAGMAENLRWPQEGFDKAFQEVVSLGMAKADWEARLIWLPRGPQHNPPQSPNVVTGWGKFWPEIPSCDLKDEILQGLEEFLASLDKPKPFEEAFHKALHKDSVESGTGAGTGIVLPAWLDKSAWDEWMAYRGERRLSTTPRTIKKQIEFLGARQPQHIEIINLAIRNGWQGLFDLKDPNGNPGKTGGQSAPERVRAANAKYQ